MHYPKISIIIPIYNCELYIDKCVQSVLGQSFKCIEILLVNDGSTDNSGDICNSYALKDSRIKVLHKENGGASSARNCGLQNVNSEIVFFLDSDDWLPQNALEVIYFTMTKNSLDFLLFNPLIVKEERVYTVSDFKTDLYNKIVDNHSFYFNYTGSWAVWSGAYKTSLIKNNNLRFIEGITMEDLEFLPKYLCYAKKIMAINQHLYYHNLCNINAITKDTSKEILYLRLISYLIIAVSLNRYKDQSNAKYNQILCDYFINNYLCIFFKSLMLINYIDKVDVNKIIKLLKSLHLYPLQAYRILGFRENLILYIINNRILYTALYSIKQRKINLLSFNNKICFERILEENNIIKK